MTTISVKGGHVVVGDEILQDACFEISGAYVQSVDSGMAAGDVEIDLDGGWLLPGFVDTQVNGGGGVLFNNAPNVKGLAAIATAHARFGTTALLPTLISDTPEAIAAALDAVDAALIAGVPGIVGVHIEGPFISRARKGIHDASQIRAIDRAVIDLLCRPRNAVVMMTLAPEMVADADIARLVAAGVILSAGHSDASYEQARAGFAAGISGVTHLYNAMSPLLHRAPGMVGAAFTDDSVWCGIIADGIHVAAGALDVALRVKGADKLMLVTDAMPSVGSSEESFLLNGRRMSVRDGMCVGEDGTLAGAHLDMAQAVRNMRAATGVDMRAISRMASGSPAAFLGIGHQRGVLSPGLRADFVVLDAGLQPVATWIGGVKVATA